MKIQRGIVKYKNRDDIECVYYVTDDGVQFYSLDAGGKKLKNGNIIVSTVLVEAIDPMVKASHIGIIDSDGNVVIPCNNKSIREVDDNIVIVEVAEPTSQSVIDAINLRSDPLSATKLVSATADVKDRLNAKMGSTGRFLFNDLFSEAALYDIDGNQIVDGYYSFIGMADRKLYMSKNTGDSEIVEYSILPPEVQNNNLVEDNREALDVTAVDVPSDTVENALNSYGEVALDNNESVDNVSPSNYPVDTVVPDTVDSQKAESLTFDSLSDQPVTSEESTYSIPDESTNVANETVAEEDLNSGSADFEEDLNPAEYDLAIPEPNVGSFQEESVHPLGEESVEVNDPIMDLFGENYQSNLEESPELNTSFMADSLEDFDAMSDSSEMVETFRKFIEQFKIERQQNQKYKEQIKAFDNYRQKMDGKLNSQQRELVNLKSELDDSKSVIHEQKAEIVSLKEALAAKTKETEGIRKLLPAIREIVGDDKDDSFDSFYEYKKVA